eukprot:scaffold16984_cov168-Skeletonema_marinoi.AAC.2
MAKSGLEKRQIGKKRKEADEQHATLFSFYCLPLRYILTPGSQPVRETVTYVTPRPLPPPVGIEFLRTLQYVFSRSLLRNNVTDTRHASKW